jgi:hypothetical protein
VHVMSMTDAHLRNARQYLELSTLYPYVSKEREQWCRTWVRIFDMEIERRGISTTPQ